MSDTFNGRVLEFNQPFSDGENASLVLGQIRYNSSVSSTTQSLLVGPEALVFDQLGNLWVLDSAASRALEFTLPELYHAIVIPIFIFPNFINELKFHNSADFNLIYF